ncbi:E3 ubiquitin-protein ligase TRIM39-like isoform X2 [Lissotriton helveticus]
MGCKSGKAQGPEVKKYKVMVTLDPETAHPFLLLCEEGKHVQDTDTSLHMPDCPKRFTLYSCVLGEEGFTSGKHYWEVQVLKDGVAWLVGVAAESVNRKGVFTSSPKENVWALQRCNSEYSALTCPPTPLSPCGKPLKVGVYLDYEAGQVSLYNADSLDLLFTFPPATFKEKLFPFYQLWGGAEMRMV